MLRIVRSNSAWDDLILSAKGVQGIVVPTQRANSIRLAKHRSPIPMQLPRVPDNVHEGIIPVLPITLRNETSEVAPYWTGHGYRVALRRPESYVRNKKTVSEGPIHPDSDVVEVGPALVQVPRPYFLGGGALDMVANIVGNVASGAKQAWSETDKTTKYTIAGLGAAVAAFPLLKRWLANLPLITAIRGIGGAGSSNGTAVSASGEVIDSPIVGEVPVTTEQAKAWDEDNLAVPSTTDTYADVTYDYVVGCMNLGKAFRKRADQEYLLEQFKPSGDPIDYLRYRCPTVFFTDEGNFAPTSVPYLAPLSGSFLSGLKKAVSAVAKVASAPLKIVEKIPVVGKVVSKVVENIPVVGTAMKIAKTADELLNSGGSNSSEPTEVPTPTTPASDATDYLAKVAETATPTTLSNDADANVKTLANLAVTTSEGSTAPVLEALSTGKVDFQNLPQYVKRAIVKDIDPIALVQAQREMAIPTVATPSTMSGSPLRGAPASIISRAIAGSTKFLSAQKLAKVKSGWLGSFFNKGGTVRAEANLPAAGFFTKLVDTLPKLPKAIMGAAKTSVLVIGGYALVDLYLTGRKLTEEESLDPSPQELLSLAGQVLTPGQAEEINQLAKEIDNDDLTMDNQDDPRVQKLAALLSAALITAQARYTNGVATAADITFIEKTKPVINAYRLASGQEVGPAVALASDYVEQAETGEVDAVREAPATTEQSDDEQTAFMSWLGLSESNQQKFIDAMSSPTLEKALVILTAAGAGAAVVAIATKIYSLIAASKAAQTNPVGKLVYRSQLF